MAPGSPWSPTEGSGGLWGQRPGWTLHSHPQPLQRGYTAAVPPQRVERRQMASPLATCPLGRIFWSGCPAPPSPSLSSCRPSRIGGEKVILLSASAWGFITAATPLLAHLGSAQLVFMTFSRILTGLLQGRGTAASVQLSALGVLAHACLHRCVCVRASGVTGSYVCSCVLLEWHALNQSRHVNASGLSLRGLSSLAGGQFGLGKVARGRSPLPAASSHCSSLGWPVCPAMP